MDVGDQARESRTLTYWLRYSTIIDVHRLAEFGVLVGKSALVHVGSLGCVLRAWRTLVETCPAWTDVREIVRALRLEASLGLTEVANDSLLGGCNIALTDPRRGR